MTETDWTWILFAAEIYGLTGMYLVGKKLWYGWAIVLTHSIPWFIYSIIYNKPGFIAMSLMWWTMYTINMIKWKNQKNPQKSIKKIRKI
jgi:hypothetical protein